VCLASGRNEETKHALQTIYIDGLTRVYFLLTLSPIHLCFSYVSVGVRSVFAVNTTMQQSDLHNDAQLSTTTLLLVLWLLANIYLL
jgi:uncharacterized membrane protein